MSSNITQKKRFGFFGDMLELAFFGAALFFLIPPVTSNIDNPPDFMTSRVFAIFAFALGRGLAVTRGKKSIIYAATELLIFCLFVWILYLRLQAG